MPLRRNRGRRSPAGTRWWIILLGAVTAVLIGVCAWKIIEDHRRGRFTVEAPPAATHVVEVVHPFRQLVLPTDQQRLLDLEPAQVLQPTASGRPESGMFGSVRTSSRGGASHHEGIDIAATRRDRAGRPLDDVHAVADGRVAYVSRHSGNSNYGVYVVLLHADPIGDVYTLYAHLAQPAVGLAPGRAVRAGEVIGRMGNTPSSIIPMANAHLHFEAGLIVNARFGLWFSAQRLKPDHGVYHGWNLLGVDPMAFLRLQRERGDAFDFIDSIRATGRAFDIVAGVRARPDYFRRYPALWTGDPFRGPAVVMACAQNGLPLAARNATPEEVQQLGRRKALVRNVDESVLGRNGCRLVARKDGSWVLGSNGDRWLEILCY